VEQVTRLTNLTTGGPVHVDVRDGRIVRMVPLELDESDGPPGTVHSYESVADCVPLGARPLADHAGCSNILTPRRSVTPTSTGMAPNSCLIQVEKWDRMSA
jgi:anaerobic selenocysteine-containing dehydrogenase